jgi:hypothetical protein
VVAVELRDAVHLLVGVQAASRGPRHASPGPMLREEPRSLVAEHVAKRQAAMIASSSCPATGMKRERGRSASQGRQPGRTGRASVGAGRGHPRPVGAGGSGSPG